jgi:lysozyme
MRKFLYIILTLLICLGVSDQLTAKTKKRRAKTRSHVVKKKNSRRRAAAKPIARPFDGGSGNPYLQCEDTCEHIHGIDLSHYQGQVFWETVGEHTKMAYVYLKATEGGDRIDSYFERNIELAHRYGLKVGSYHFFRPKTELDRQLRNFMTQCLPGEQDLIPMVDVETTGGLSLEQFRDSLQTFLRMMEIAYRQKPLVYTFRNFYNKHLQGGLLDDYPLMIAMYTEEEPVLEDGRDYTMWQYTGKGRIVGVNGFVDKSRFVGDHTLHEIRFRH